MRSVPFLKGCAGVLLILSTLSCVQRKAEPLHLVCIVDLTASIDPKAQEESFTAIQAVIKKLNRGDSMTVIPITGDALTEGQGHTLRFQVNERREAYDADLRRLAQDTQRQLIKLQKEAARPYTRSDILGALDLATEELSLARGNTRKIVVVLSDFIQDDSQYNFKRDAALKNEPAARRLAQDLAAKHAQAFAGTTIYLGLLRSFDLKSVPQTRRAAIRTFWTEYCRLAGASSVYVTTDGPGQLAQFLRSSAEPSA